MFNSISHIRLLPILLLYLYSLLAIQYSNALYDTSKLTVTERYYAHYNKKTSTSTSTESRIEKLPLRSIPKILENRLKAGGSSLTFDTLPSLLQRAFLWDAGYISTGGGSFQQIWIPCNALTTMDEINLSLERFEAGSCTTIACKNKHYRQDATKNECIETLLNVHLLMLKCGIVMDPLIESYIMSNSTPIWTTESKVKIRTLPAPHIIIHPMNNDNQKYIPSIHLEKEINQQNTVPERASNCPINYDATIPCRPLDSSTTSTGEWCLPQMSKRMISWLVETAVKRLHGEKNSNDSDTSDVYGETKTGTKTDGNDRVVQMPLGYIPSSPLNIPMIKDTDQTVQNTSQKKNHGNISSTENDYSVQRNAGNKYLVSLLPTILGFIIVASIIVSVVLIRRKRLNQAVKNYSDEEIFKDNDQYDNTMYQMKESLDLSGQTFSSTSHHRSDNELSVSDTERR